MSKENIVIRPFASIPEYHLCQEVQLRVWGLKELEVVPYHQLLTAATNGGMILGAFDGAVLAGFCYGFVGLNEIKEPLICSHMLAVLPEYRGLGLGYRLKIAQREKALERGIKIMNWTYDPLEATNAYLNIHRLGGIVSCYYPNHYGKMLDELNWGLPSDRLLLEWHLESTRVRSILQGNSLKPPGEAAAVLSVRSDVKGPRPTGLDLGAQGKLLVEVPVGFQTLKKEQPALALEWRKAVREVMNHYLSRGYLIKDVLRPSPNLAAYVLTPPIRT